MRNIRSIYLTCTNVCNLVIVFATLFYLFFALFYCYSLSGVQLKKLGLSLGWLKIILFAPNKRLWRDSRCAVWYGRFPWCWGHTNTLHFCRAIVSISMSGKASIKYCPHFLVFQVGLEPTQNHINNISFTISMKLFWFYLNRF